MTLTFKALGALLAYPSPELVAALPEIIEVVQRDSRLTDADKKALRALASRLADSDPLDLQERYVELFDRGRATSLHLFEHVHGDSRERGQAMVDLKRIYANAGFELAVNELPDYLPLMLEYLSQRPYAEARDMLGDCAHILRSIGESLQDRGSGYSAALAGLLTMTGEPGLPPPSPSKRAAREPTIDEEWVDEPVIFGPDAVSGCGAAEPKTSVVQFMPRRS